MDSIQTERVRVVIAKIEIALGFDVRSKNFSNAMDIERAIRILGELKENIDNPHDETPLELLSLDPRTCFFLYEGGVDTVEELARMPDNELIQIDQIRGGRLAEIDAALREVGLERKKQR